MAGGKTTGQVTWPLGPGAAAARSGPCEIHDGKPLGSRRRVGLRASCLTGAAALVLTAFPAAAQQGPTLNFQGVPGLIDMPGGAALPDAEVTAVTSYFGGITRTTGSFQFSPRITASFRYLSIRNWDRNLPPSEQDGYETYYDRSFDLRFLLLEESANLPAVTLGFQDFIGTGILSGEYLAATKEIMPRLRVTGGLGWGRLGARGALGSPFGSRPDIDFGEGGKPTFSQMFRGPMAPFGGVEWQASERLGLKVEYSSEGYDEEAGRRGVFERKSRFNFGAEYQITENVRLGGYYLYGSEFGASLQVALNPRRRPGNMGIQDAGPIPVRLRPSPERDAEAWSPSWADHPDSAAILRDNVAKYLEADGMRLEALTVSATHVQLRYRNLRYDAVGQSIGRAARILTHTLPASVETFELIPVVEGMPAASVSLRRSDVEALEHAPDAAAAMQARRGLADAGALPPGALTSTDLYPRFTWSIGPYARLGLFDPDEPVRGALGARLRARYDIAPGFVLSGSVTKNLVSNLDKQTRFFDSSSDLQRVRSETRLYDSKGDPALETLTMAWYAKPAADIYSRITVGYLERMFGGVSGEVLWKPATSRLGLGAELNYVQQRSFNQGLGFRDYSVVTGHVSAYYDLGAGYHAQIDVGRYLAEDWGTTLSLDREFANGWRVGAFATFTDVPSEAFGEGSFDKGIRVSIPVTWVLGTPTRNVQTATIRPLTRDGGARLEVDGRLYETVRGYHQGGIDGQWGRFWR
ncbi:YjbH domain-containing protein [Plastorhodobacter daqingensis]|uniref:YjbH domain-containing protein n=1 Tax=Plastorhodobacter daqingensis TaxID=1387281 RepID=A0ABW2UHW9_9RHOB